MGKVECNLVEIERIFYNSHSRYWVSGTADRRLQSSILPANTKHKYRTYAVLLKFLYCVKQDLVFLPLKTTQLSQEDGEKELVRIA